MSDHLIQITQVLWLSAGPLCAYVSVMTRYDIFMRAYAVP